MSEQLPDDEQLRAKVSQYLDAFREYWRRAHVGKLTGSEWAELQELGDKIDAELKPLRWELPGPANSQDFQAHFNLLEFYERMRERQGTKMPDFQALYRSKEELERRFRDEPKDAPGAQE